MVPDYSAAMAPRFWLTKSEPDAYSIHDLERDGRTHWEGVRNYTARIHLRAMEPGDQVLFYHSNAEPSGVVGVARVVRAAYPDRTALDPDSKYYDPGATEADPRWVMIDVAHVETWPRLVSLEELKGDPVLEGMEVTRKGSRLSVTPVAEQHFARVLERSRMSAPADESARPTPARAAASGGSKAPEKKATKKYAKKKAAKKKVKAPNKKASARKAQPKKPTARAAKTKTAASPKASAPRS